MARTRAGTRERGKWPAAAKLAIDLRGGMPVAKGSMRGFVVHGGGKPRAVVSDTKTPELRAFERDIRQLIDREMNRLALPCAFEQPFEVLIVYYLPRPAGDFDKHGGLRATARCSPWVKPDLDKLERATLDALTGMAWDDDARVVRTVKEKRYATADRDIGLWIEVRVLAATMRERMQQAQPLLSVINGGA